MSGIAGLLHFDGQPLDEARLSAMSSSIAYRGPDGEGTWREQHVGFAHRMLHVTPESLRERQPYRAAESGVVVTADARVDNRDDLIRILGLRPAPQDVTDSQLIAAAYERWGVEAPLHLIGDFAFALWDPRAHRLLCATDPFGVKPLYYHHRPGSFFAFGSEPKCILALPDFERQLCDVRMADLLTFLRGEEELTLYKGIHRLPQATSVVVANGALHLHRYWQPELGAPVRAADNREYAEQFLSVMREAVRCRTRSAFPIGSHLSGGLDSSFVTCLARDEGSRPSSLGVHAFSMVFSEHRKCDESAYIDAVTREGGVVSHRIDADQLSPLGNIREVCATLDDHTPAGNQHFGWAMLQAAHREGVRVMLDGFDGDNTVNHGYVLLLEHVRAGRWEAFADNAKLMASRYQDVQQMQNFERAIGSTEWALRAYAYPWLGRLADDGSWREFERGAASLNRHFGISRGHTYRRFARRLVVPSWLLRMRRRMAPPVEAALPDILEESFAKQIEYRRRAERLASRPETNHREVSARDMQRARLTLGFQGTLTVQDHYSARLGIESRHPFLDRRLIEFCLSLPPEQSLQNGWTRYVMREAMAGIVPEPVRWRVGKADINDHYVNTVRRHDRPLIASVLDDLGPLSHVVSPAFAGRARRDFESLEMMDLLKLGTLVALRHVVDH